MMHCGFGGFLCVVGAIAIVKLLFRAFGRHHRRFHGGCGPRQFGRGPCGQGPYRGGHGGGWGSPWDHHDHHEHGSWDDGDSWQGRGGRRGGWGARKLGWLFQGLETTPEQERVLFETFGELRGAGGKIAGKVAESRAQWADALEAETFDETMVGNAVADLEHAVDEARKTAIDAFAKVHGTLDAPQRKRLADLLRRRRGPFGGFGR
jgi:uncharacterized membrane protein